MITDNYKVKVAHARPHKKILSLFHTSKQEFVECYGYVVLKQLSVKSVTRFPREMSYRNRLLHS